MSSPPVPPRTDGPRAWVVIAAATLAAAVTLGTVTSHGVLVDALGSVSVLGMAAGALLVGTSSAVQFGLGPLVGSLTERTGIRPTLALATGGYASGAAGAAVLADRGFVGAATVVYALGTGAAGACTLTPLLATAAAWCVRRRSAAVAVMSAANALGAAALAPWFTRLVARSGLVGVWRASAVIGTAALLVAGLVVRDPPAPRPARTHRLRAAAVLADAGLRRFYLAGVLGSAAAITATAYLVPFAMSLGFHPERAAALLAATGAIGVLTRLGVGALPARRAFHAYRVTSLALVVAGVAWIAAPAGAGWLVVFVVSFGALAGSWAALAPLVVADAHQEGLATILGVLYTAPALGGLAGSVLVGALLRGAPLATIGVLIAVGFGGAAAVLRPLTSTDPDAAASGAVVPVAGGAASARRQGPLAGRGRVARRRTEGGTGMPGRRSAAGRGSP
jgi:predicted MFS family arabinose efflux permease